MLADDGDDDGDGGGDDKDDGNDDTDLLVKPSSVSLGVLVHLFHRQIRTCDV